MSKTSIKERNKAIRLAWEREQKLVAEGKGTRDWSQDQQKDILDPNIGKAKDANGRSFEGQHMKSAAEYPEYQGDPDNIQFLTRDEHLAAHKGSWQNPTNWYYNPETKEFVDFGENKPIPCVAISLSESVCSPVIGSQDMLSLSVRWRRIPRASSKLRSFTATAQTRKKRTALLTRRTRRILTRLTKAPVIFWMRLSLTIMGCSIQATQPTVTDSRAIIRMFR